MKLPLALASVAFAFGSAASAETLVYSSPETPVALVELYSSEGCSSCPPADSWFSALKNNPGLWTSFVPVVFHVDYWDSAAWRDRFSSHANTARQERYAAAWGSGTVYTPGVVWNGREWRGWRAVAAPPILTPTRVGVLRLAVRDGKSAEFRFTPALAISGAVTAEVALLGFNLASDVQRGENSGRHLRHDFVVLGISTVPLKLAGTEYVGAAPLGSFADAPNAVAAWVRSADGEPPLQATGGWLRAAK